jgi:hypothetical protein
MHNTNNYILNEQYDLSNDTLSNTTFDGLNILTTLGLPASTSEWRKAELANHKQW